MYKRFPQDIKQHLQNEEAKARVLQNMQRGREEATVTIGRAARLFNFTENKLRDWENLGLLKPLRSKDIAGQRQYPPEELDKLAIIKELIEEGGYTPGEIPPDIDKIWAAVASEQTVQTARKSREAEHLHLDQRLDSAYEALFWRYYGSHVLQLSLMLICEDIPDTIAGLVLPLREDGISGSVRYPSDLPLVGESLIGWLGRNRSFYTILDSAPSFEYPTDFRVVPLQAVGEDTPKDNTLIVVQRKAKTLILTNYVVECIRRLLAPLYEVKDWRPYFGQGMRDLLYLAPDFTSGTNISDDTLNGFADMIARLGGKTEDGRERWRFCCILLPEDPALPLQQRSLIVRAPG
jgi:DNA-binding transcriptional MerR regulator